MAVDSFTVAGKNRSDGGWPQLCMPAWRSYVHIGARNADDIAI